MLKFDKAIQKKSVFSFIYKFGIRSDGILRGRIELQWLNIGVYSLLLQLLLWVGWRIWWRRIWMIIIKLFLSLCWEVGKSHCWKIQICCYLWSILEVPYSCFCSYFCFCLPCQHSPLFAALIFDCFRGVRTLIFWLSTCFLILKFLPSIF